MASHLPQTTGNAEERGASEIAKLKKRKLHCSQCGQLWGAWACGPTHALMAETDYRDLAETYSEAYRAGAKAGKIDGIHQAAAWMEKHSESVLGKFSADIAALAAAGKP